MSRRAKILEIKTLGKVYRLGKVGSGTLSGDLKRQLTLLKGGADPNLPIDTSGRQVGDKIWALRDLNFEVAQGEVLGLIGKNGAGKSTLLKLLSQVTTPSTGHIKAKGRIASLLEVGTGMHPELTGRENVFLNGARLPTSLIKSLNFLVARPTLIHR
jgi:lipopolysaccharide transport system ATP-binding protein